MSGAPTLDIIRDLMRSPLWRSRYDFHNRWRAERGMVPVTFQGFVDYCRDTFVREFANYNAAQAAQDARAATLDEFVSDIHRTWTDLAALVSAEAAARGGGHRTSIDANVVSFDRAGRRPEKCLERKH
jgi:hypothetical protein